PQQFANPANPQAHYDTTGPEIYEQLQGQIDIFVAGVGTGGTFTGTARYLKEKIPGLRAVAVEPEGSILCGGQPGPHRTEGIGVEFIPETLDTRLIDKVYTVSDDDAFAMVRSWPGGKESCAAAPRAWRFTPRGRRPSRPGPAAPWSWCFPTAASAT